ncbi:hypothetical protein BHL31_00495 [Bacillus cereus]|nr:hypothetical protein BHL31_00495 [Bacillus cereus]HDR7454405.1 hypothetical protein [Bacillus cereus]
MKSVRNLPYQEKKKLWVYFMLYDQTIDREIFSNFEQTAPVLIICIDPTSAKIDLAAPKGLNPNMGRMSFLIKP